MFQVGRYNPDDHNKSKSKRKRAGSHEEKGRKQKQKQVTPESKQSLDSAANAFAPEVEGRHNSISKKHVDLVTEEAFDDLEIVEELLGDTTTERVPSAFDESDNTGDISHEVASAVQMAKIPIEEAASKWGLATFLLENIKKEGFKTFFPIQTLSIPDAVLSGRHGHIQARDICITAPTGSGKTLAYVLPILNALANRKVTRLRGLVVLPSRDLARQVHHVFERYSEGSSLKVGLAIGQSDFQEEQAALSVDPSRCDLETARRRLNFQPDKISLAIKASSGLGCKRTVNERTGTSAVDVLVCTPGRLVDHLDNTPDFSCEHLRFLVVDEADRLLSQSYHNWVERVIESANSGSVTRWKTISNAGNEIVEPEVSNDGSSIVLKSTTWRRGRAGGDHSAFSTNDAFSSVTAAVCQPVQLRKFLVSATLTRDPQKLASLKLVNPKHFDIHQIGPGGQRQSNKKYAMPTDLSECTIECSAEQKPVVLVALILDHLSHDRDSVGSSVVVFTSSVDSTHRLSRLLQIIWSTCQIGSVDEVVEFSSALNQNERSRLMRRCQDKKVSVIICSDGLSRGMDIESVGIVVNYDIPVLAKTYVHRCGRTARAGRQGSAVSLLKGGQVHQFQKMRNLIRCHERVQPGSIKKHLVGDVVRKYGQCVKALREVLEAEDNGELGHTEPIDAEALSTVP